MYNAQRTGRKRNKWEKEDNDDEGEAEEEEEKEEGQEEERKRKKSAHFVLSPNRSRGPRPRNDSPPIISSSLSPVLFLLSRFPVARSPSSISVSLPVGLSCSGCIFSLPFFACLPGRRSLCSLYQSGVAVGFSPGLYHPTVVRGGVGRLGVVYDRVYTPAGKYCRRAPPLDFLTKIVCDRKQRADPAAAYIENSGKFRGATPPFLRNFSGAGRPRIDADRFLSGRTARDKTLPADRSIYGQGRRREGRAREVEPGDGGYNMGYRGGPTPGGEQGPSFYYPSSHRGSQPSLELRRSPFNAYACPPQLLCSSLVDERCARVSSLATRAIGRTVLNNL